jgi:hypothetical protein
MRRGGCARYPLLPELRCGDRDIAAMTSTQQLQVSPIPASIDNVGEWEVIARQIASESGLPTTVTPELLVGMIGSAVPLLFEADAAKDMNLLRGTFTDPVIAQCQRNAGSFADEQPISAVVDLVGAHMADGHPVLRARLSIQVQDADGSRSATNQFWDLQLGAQVTVGQSQCPNCGAPIATGELICGHCRADVRSVVEAPLVVSRLELY